MIIPTLPTLDEVRNSYEKLGMNPDSLEGSIELGMIEEGKNNYIAIVSRKDGSVEVYAVNPDAKQYSKMNVLDGTRTGPLTVKKAEWIVTMSHGRDEPIQKLDTSTFEKNMEGYKLVKPIPVFID